MTTPESRPLDVLVVDDETPARQRLRTLLADIAAELPNRVVGEAANGVAALALLDEVGADVVLADVRMPRMDGIELARHLRRRAAPPAVIFTTAYDHYAVTAFDLAAVDYLMKPIRAARLAEALRKVIDARHLPAAESALATLQAAPRRFLPCTERGRHLLVPVDELLYLKADAKYVLARTAEREFLLDESLTHLEAEFGDRFLRLHRSVLVVRTALAGLESARSHEGEYGWALLRGVADRLPVSRRQWGEAKRFLAELGGHPLA